MRKFKERFVFEYRAVLSIKKEGKKSPEVPMFHVLSGSIILLLLLGLFTIIFNLSENLHFVLLSSNLFLVGSFLLYRLMKEMIFKHINRLEYVTIYGLVYDVIWFITCLSIFNTLIYFLILRAFVATSLIVVNLLIGIIGMVLYGWLKPITYGNESPIYDVFLVTNWMFVVFFGIFYALGISSLIAGYLISFGILVGLTLVKRLIPRFLFMSSDNFLGLLFLVFSLGVMITWRVVDDEENTIGPLIGRTTNTLDGSFVVNDSFLVRYQLFEKGLMIDHPDYVTILDENLNPLLTIEKENDETFYIIENTLYKMILSDNQDDLYTELDTDIKRFDIYKYDETYSFDFFDTINYNPSDNIYKSNVFFFLDDALHYVRHQDPSIIYSKNGEVIERNYPRYGIIYEDEYSVIFTLNYVVKFNVGYLYDIPYHNGIVVDGRCIDTIQEYIEKIPTVCNNLRLSEPIVTNAQIYIHKEKYYILNSTYELGRHIIVFDAKGNQEEQIPDVFRLFYYQDQFMVVKRQSINTEEGLVNQDVVYLLNPNAHFKSIVLSQTGLTPYVVIFWVGWVYMIPISLNKEDEQ